MIEKQKTFLQKLSDFIFGKTITIQHPFFGELVDTGEDYEGQILFRPTEKSIGIRLEKTTHEIEEKQVAFFKVLEADYDKLIELISPAITLAVADWIPGYRISDFKKEFILENIEISDLEEE